jgi:hypothetical protein
VALFQVDTIAQWLEDFRASGEEIPEMVRLLERDFADEDRQDAGLVLIQFEVFDIESYLERPSHERPEWVVHFGSRGGDVSLSATDLTRLMGELQFVAKLTAFLEARTAEALAKAV